MADDAEVAGGSVSPAADVQPPIEGEESASSAAAAGLLLEPDAGKSTPHLQSSKCRENRCIRYGEAEGGRVVGEHEGGDEEDGGGEEKGE